MLESSFCDWEAASASDRSTKGPVLVDHLFGEQEAWDIVIILISREAKIASQWEQRGRFRYKEANKSKRGH
jgi:hypothetical protein